MFLENTLPSGEVRGVWGTWTVFTIPKEEEGDPFRNCHLQVRKETLTPPEPLALRSTFAELLPRNALSASVHRYRKGLWPLPSSDEEPGL